jgi:hypothetical protein
MVGDGSAHAARAPRHLVQRPRGSRRPAAYPGAVTKDHEPDQAPATPHPELQPLAVDSVRIVVGGTALFAVALVVTLLVPALHSGDRDWWPWACASGLALGLIGLAYILRGRGNAAGARRR